MKRKEFVHLRKYILEDVRDIIHKSEDKIQVGIAGHLMTFVIEKFDEYEKTFGLEK